MPSRPTHWTLPLCGLLAVLSVPAARAQEGGATPPIKWRKDYLTARKEAQEKNLPLLIDFFTVPCPYCDKQDATTLRDPEVVKALNGRFVPLKVDATQDKKLAELLRINMYPTVVLAGPDGRILGSLEGYQEVGSFRENLKRALASLAPPDWMQRDLQNAVKWAAAGDYARAVPVLRTILEDGKARPLQVEAQKLLTEIEQKGAERLVKAKGLQQKGDTVGAITALTETMRDFPGLKVSRDASALMTTIVQSAEVRTQLRGRRARELLTQARDFYKSKDYIPCLDRCEILLGHYGDLAEGQQAATLALEIKNNPEWLQNAADTMTDRLGGLYLALADSLLKRGQVQRAEFYLQRVVQAFPGSRQAESAQIRLGQLSGVRPTQVQIQSARP